MLQNRNLYGIHGEESSTKTKVVSARSLSWRLYVVVKLIRKLSRSYEVIWPTV